MEFTDLMIFLVGLALIIFALVCVIVISMTDVYPTIKEFESEAYYVDMSNGKRKHFLSFKEMAKCTLSVVVPAYNEEERLIPMMNDALDYLEMRSKKDEFTYEVIIVDDGSSDKTSDVALKYGEKYGSDKIKVLTLVENRGKGGAVRLGMMRCSGEMLLFADADGATKFSDFGKLESVMRNMGKDCNDIGESLGIVCGSRAHLEKDSVSQRSFFRTILMYGFHFVVWLFAVRDIKDTQCGFKLLTRRSARIIFSSLHIERWAFDAEMLFIAQSLGIPIEEVAVTWTEIDGSKVTPVLSWIQMGIDLALLWLRYAIGAWKIKSDSS